MNYRPPLGFFGNFILQEQEKAKEILNIKNAMRLIVDFGRIYAIKSNLVETNTLRRLQAIYRQDRMNEALGDIMHAYEFLMYQRLKHQSQSMRGKRRAAE
jgi:CBS domain-containing protein